MNLTLEQLQFQQVSLSTGVRLNYAEQGDPSGQPIIFLHGYTDSWFSFSSVLSSLSPDYHAYALDQRGHGDSERPERGYTLRDFAADVIAFMDAMGLERATIAGHCMGSFVAQEVALTAPHRVSKLVLISSATSLRQEGIIDLGRAVQVLDDPVPEEFARAFQMSTVYRTLPDDFMDRVIEQSLKLPAAVWRAVLAGLLEEDPSVPPSLIRVPTLIVWGDRDSIFLRAEQDALFAQIPEALLRVYPMTGHSPQWERPQQFAHHLEDFMNSESL